MTARPTTSHPDIAAGSMFCGQPCRSSSGVVTWKPTGDIFHVYPGGASDGGGRSYRLRRDCDVRFQSVGLAAAYSTLMRSSLSPISGTGFSSTATVGIMVLAPMRRGKKTLVPLGARQLSSPGRATESRWPWSSRLRERDHGVLRKFVSPNGRHLESGFFPVGKYVHG